MKMYLSSYKFGDNPEKLLGLFGANKKIAVISNALDFSHDIAKRNEGTHKEIDWLNQFGLSAEEIDLRKYFTKPRKLEEKLSDFGALWVRGGNVFVLRRAFKESGLDVWLAKQKDNPEFIYAGYSAGVCILSPTLRGYEIVDDPTTVGEGYSDETIWEGLGLIDFAFAPHYRSDHPESEAVDKEVENYIKKGIKFKALSDGEVIILK